jgi:hypothetical protein
MANSLLADTTFIALRVTVFLIILYPVLRFIKSRTVPRPSPEIE